MTGKAALALVVLSAILVYGALSQPTIPQAAPSRGGAAYVFTVESLSASPGPSPTRTVTIVLSYYGKYTLLGSSALVTPQCNASVLSSQPVPLGSWRPGTAKTFSITVNGTGAGARCPLSIQIMWQDEWNDATSMNTQAGGGALLEAELAACWSEDIRVRVDPQVLYLNSINSVTLEVANAGGSAVGGFTVTVSGQGLTILNATVPLIYRVGSMPPGAVLRAPLQLVPQSSFPSISVTVSYVDCTGSLKTSTYMVPLYASQGQSIIVVPNPSTVAVGARSNVTLNVVNLGSVEAENLSVILNLQGSPIAINPSVIEAGDLKPGQAKAFTVTVDVPSTATASTPVSFQAVYYAPGGGLALAQGTFTLFLIQQSSLYITSIDVVPQHAEEGSSVVFAVNMINDGTYPVYAVNVTAQAPEGLVPARAPYTFLGQLNPQVLTSVPFSFKAAKAGSYEVKFTVKYRDAYGNARVAEKTAVVEVVPPAPKAAEGGAQANPLAYAAALAAALALLYLLWRSRRRGAGA